MRAGGSEDGLRPNGQQPDPVLHGVDRYKSTRLQMHARAVQSIHYERPNSRR